LCATQFSSEYMDVISDNGTWQFELSFKKGFNVTLEENEKGFIKKKSTGTTGTTIKWKPDLDVFTQIDISDDYYRDVLRRQAIVNDGLEFVFRREVATGEFDEEIFCYQNGIEDYLKEIVGENALTNPQLMQAQKQGRDREDKPEYKVKLKVAFVFSNKVKLIEHYHNSSWLEHGGSPDKALRQAFVYQIDAYLKNNNKYQKNESKITFADVEDSLVFVSSNFSTQTSYENQTKKAINNKFIQDAMSDWLKHNLEIYFMENPDEAVRICEQVLVNKRSRENADKMRQNIRKKLEGSIDLSNRVEKFVDCRSKDIDKRELYIVEGDSALGSVKLARDSDYQAIMPVRGKILNCLKAGYDKIFKSEIITNLLKVLGCGVEVESKANKELSNFSLDNLRWNKVVICTDADYDGYQIRTLILTMLYRLTPGLIHQGYFFFAPSPLYELYCKDD
ncbi:MAG: DNA topoisomerase, partial [Ruminiclostridium sp.]|nr:DNA topoisomerase [Ruminiclostridium sp.]